MTFCGGVDFLILEIILDTNILIYISEGKFNIHSEIERIIPQKHELVILSASIEELKYLSKKQPLMKKHLRFIQNLYLSKRFKKVEIDKDERIVTDQKIVNYALEEKSIRLVATNDIKLKNQLREEGIAVLFMKTFNHLELIGYIK